MPVSLHQRLIESAAREGVSLNQYIVATLAAAERWSSTPVANRATDRDR
jgi:hypothetical protein